MKKRYTEQEKQQLIEDYGTVLDQKKSCQRFAISRSTYYRWLKNYKKVETYSGKKISYRNIQKLEVKVHELELQQKIYDKTNCNKESSQDAKFEAIYN